MYIGKQFEKTHKRGLFISASGFIYFYFLIFLSFAKKFKIHQKIGISKNFFWLILYLKYWPKNMLINKNSTIFTQTLPKGATHQQLILSKLHQADLFKQTCIILHSYIHSLTADSLPIVLFLFLVTIGALQSNLLLCWGENRPKK